MYTNLFNNSNETESSLSALFACENLQHNKKVETYCIKKSPCHGNSKKKIVVMRFKVLCPPNFILCLYNNGISS